MPNAPMTIGPVTLTNFEVPQSVCFGGRQRVAVHALTDGRRVIEPLGPDDADIRFEGVFSGANAEDRVRALDALRVAGKKVWLTWATFQRQVVIKSFIATYQSPWWISYRISCLVVGQSRTTSSWSANLWDLISGDFANALSAASGSTIALTPLQAIFDSSSSADSGSSNQAISTTVVGSTLRSLDTEISRQSTLLEEPIVAGMDPSSISASYGSIVGYAGTLAAAVNVKSYIGMIAVNLGTAGA